MDVAIDIETQGLDATKFIMGCIMRESKRNKIYYDKHDMWLELIRLGKQEKKRGKVLNVYGHNLGYDFYGIADLEDKGIHYFCERPFIAEYKNKEGETIIHFIDNMGIYRKALAKVGEMIGFEKMET